MNLAPDPLPASGESGLLTRVAKNSAWLLAGRLGSQGLALLFSILVARRLGEVGLGQYAFMASVVFLGNLTTTFGTDMLIMREVAAKRDLSMLPAALLLQLGLSIPFILLVFVFAPLIPNQAPEAVSALRLYSLALLPLAVYSVFSAALRGLERMAAFTWLNFISGALLAGSAWFYLQPDTSIEALAGLLLLVNLILSLVTVVIYRAQAPGVWVWEISATKLAAMLAVAAPIAVLGLLGALYQRTGIYLLSGMQGAAATGQFSAALRLVEAAKLGHFALLGAVFPLMAQAQAAPSVAFQALFAKTLRFLLLLAAGLSIFIFVLSPVLVPALFGADFSESIAVLSILAWVLIPATLTHYYSLMLLSAKRERSILVALVVSLTILVISIVWVAPLWGLAAVAWAVVVAEVIQAAILFYYWRVQPPPEVGHAAA